MNVEYWFPTVTASHFVSQEVKTATSNSIATWVDSGEHTDYLELCKEDSLTTSYFKYHDTLGDLKLVQLREEILQCATEYILQYNLAVTQDQLQVDSWINFFYPGQSEQQHNHYGNFISGVYYVTAPLNSGVFRFYDPANQKTMWKGTYLGNSQPAMTNMTNGQHIAEEGKLLMFPSWLEHAVMTNKSNDVRISIAFNVNIKK